MPARYWQLLRKVLEQCCRHAQVAFGILKIDRVDFMRHRGRTDFIFYDFLAEVAKRNVAPNVAAQVRQYRIDSNERVRILGGPVVWFDLSGVCARIEAKCCNEALTDCRPINVRIRDHVRVEISNGTVEFAADHNVGELLLRSLQTFDEIGHFLAEGRRCRRLPVCSRQHRQACVLPGHGLQLRAELTHLRQQDIGACRAQHQCISQIVNVLGRAAEVQKVLELRCFRTVTQTFANEILDGLDVVIGRGLDFLDTFGIVERKTIDNVIEDIFHYGRQWSDFGHFWFIGKALQPPHLDEDAKAYQAVFAENVAQTVNLVRIAAIRRREGPEG